MTKPVTGVTTFDNLAPPWQTTQLDANFSALANAANDLGTYSNPLADTSGAANTITVPIPTGLTAVYAFGLLLYVKVANTTTSGSVTLNLGALGAQNVKLPNGSTPAIGAFVAGGVYPFFYDGANFQVVGGATTPAITSGTFAVTYTDGTGTVTPATSAKYQQTGNLVSMLIPAGTFATASSSALRMQGIPSALRPATVGICSAANFAFLANSAAVTGPVAGIINQSGPGEVEFTISGSTVWPAGGNKGLNQPTYLIYTLD